MYCLYGTVKIPFRSLVLPYLLYNGMSMYLVKLGAVIGNPGIQHRPQSIGLPLNNTCNLPVLKSTIN